VKITIEAALGTDVIEQFYDLYVIAFRPLQTNAAARHMLSLDEFTEEMTDPRIDKYIAWDDNGEAIALTTLTTDLAAVAWISPHYFVAKYPEHAARGALYYLGYTLVHPENEGRGVFARIAARIVRRLTEERAVCAFDVCGYNDGVHQIGQSIANLSRSLDMKMDTVDVQTYYAAAFNGPKKREKVAA
jgi:GNAT superfamily N-acetyltransferase